MRSTPGDLQIFSRGMVTASFLQSHSDSLAGISASTSNTTTGKHISQREVSHWGGERRNEAGSPAPRSPHPQPLSPTLTYARDSGTPASSATPPSSLDSFQRLALSPLRFPDRQHSMLTPLGPSPRQHPVLASLDLSFCRHPEPFGANGVGIVSPSWNQQITRTPSVYPQSNQYLGRVHSGGMSPEVQAHLLSQGPPALSPRRPRDVKVTHPSSTPRTLGQPLGRGYLNARLAAITPKNSRLTQDRKFRPIYIYIYIIRLSVSLTEFREVVSKIKQNKWYLGEIPYIRLLNPEIWVRELVTAPKPTTISSKKWYHVSWGRRIGIFYSWCVYVTAKDRILLISPQGHS